MDAEADEQSVHEKYVRPAPMPIGELLALVIPSTVIDTILTFLLPLGTPRKFVDLSGFLWLAGHPSTPHMGTTDDLLLSPLAFVNVGLTLGENTFAWVAVSRDRSNRTDVPEEAFWYTYVLPSVAALLFLVATWKASRIKGFKRGVGCYACRDRFNVTKYEDEVVYTGGGRDYCQDCIDAYCETCADREAEGVKKVLEVKQRAENGEPAEAPRGKRLTVRPRRRRECRGRSAPEPRRRRDGRSAPEPRRRRDGRSAPHPRRRRDSPLDPRARVWPRGRSAPEPRRRRDSPLDHPASSGVNSHRRSLAPISSTST